MAQLDAKSASTPAMPTSLRPRYTRTSDISEGSRIEKPQLAKYRRYTHNPVLSVIARRDAIIDVGSTGKRI